MFAGVERNGFDFCNKYFIFQKSDRSFQVCQGETNTLRWRAAFEKVGKSSTTQLTICLAKRFETFGIQMRCYLLTKLYGDVLYGWHFEEVSDLS